MRLVVRIIAVLFAILVIDFGISNNQPVELTLWPLPFTLGVPLWLLVYGTTAIALLLGWLIGWFGKVGAVRRARSAEKKVDRLEKEQSHETTATGSAVVPVPHGQSALAAANAADARHRGAHSPDGARAAS